MRPSVFRRVGGLVIVATLVVLIGCQSWKDMKEEHRAYHHPAPEQVAAAEEAQSQQIEAARTAMNSGDLDVAMGMFRDILAENPTIAPAYVGIGDIYMIRADYENAEPAYGRAARLEPRNFDAQYGHGLALQMLDRFVEAIRAYQRALTINPDSFKTNHNLAMTFLQIEEAYSALRFAERAVELDPADGPAHVNLGVVYDKLGKHGQAIDEYLTALELMDATEELLLNLVNALAKERRYQEVIGTAETLVALWPSPNAYERMGWAYFRLSEFDRSLESYRRGVELDPEHWPSLNGVGCNALNAWLLSKKRDTASAQEARRAFQQSLRINSNQPRVLALMSRYQW